jgi:hypothetical protein
VDRFDQDTHSWCGSERDPCSSTYWLPKEDSSPPHPYQNHRWASGLHFTKSPCLCKSESFSNDSRLEWSFFITAIRGKGRGGSCGHCYGNLETVLHVSCSFFSVSRALRAPAIPSSGLTPSCHVAVPTHSSSHAPFVQSGKVHFLLLIISKISIAIDKIEQRRHYSKLLQ